MGRERIVVVGGGAAGLRATERLRELNFGGELIVIGEEPYRTYHRPGLTKHLLTGTARPRELVLPVLTDLDAIWRYGVRASHLEPDEHVLHLPGGEEIVYDGLVIATGSQARHLPGAPRHDPRVHVVRTVADAVAVQKSLRRGKGGLAVIGSGFLACELASAARALGRDATIVTKDRGLLTRVPGADLGETVTALHEAHGVQIITEAEVHHWVRQQDGVAMHLTTGQVVVANCVVLAVGSVPAVSWLRGSGLILDDGVMCDATCHAIGAEDIVVAGDVARWPNLRFDTQPRRVEHWLNAVEMGRAAAENLLDGPSSAKPYTPLPRFWTDQHGMRIQGAGLPALAQDTVPLTGSVDVGQRVTGYVSNGNLVGVMGFDSPRGMLHWTAELESRTTEAMNRRPAPARREDPPARPAMPAEMPAAAPKADSWPIAAIGSMSSMTETQVGVGDGAPATQAIPVYAMSAMEAAAAMESAMARAMEGAGKPAPAGPGGGGLAAHSGMPPAMSRDSVPPGSPPSRRGPGGSMPPGGMPPIGREDSWPSSRPPRRGDSGPAMPRFGPLDSPPLGPEDSWPSMLAVGSGKSWPELPSVQAMDSWLSMPAVDSSPRLPVVRKPDPPTADTPPKYADSPSGRRARPDNAPPSSSLSDAMQAPSRRRSRPDQPQPASGRRTKEVTDSIPQLSGSRSEPGPVDATQAIPAVRETNLTRSERRARAAEVTTSIAPVRDSGGTSGRHPSPADYSPRRTSWPGGSSGDLAGPAMASVPVMPERSGRHAEPDPEPMPMPPRKPAAAAPTPFEMAQTGQMPPVRGTFPQPGRLSGVWPTSSAPDSPVVRAMPPSRGTNSYRDSSYRDDLDRPSSGMSSARMSPAGPMSRPSSGMPPAGPSSSSRMPPVDPRSSSRMPPVDPRSSSRMPPVDPRSSSRMSPVDPPSSSRMPPVDPRSSSRMSPVDPPSSSRMPPAGPRSSARMSPVDPRSSSRMSPAGPVASSPGFPPVDPRSSSRMSPAVPVASSPGFPPVDPRSSSRMSPVGPPTSSHRGMPPVPPGPGTSSRMGPAHHGMPAHPGASSPGMPPVDPRSSARMAPVHPATSSYPGMPPAPPPSTRMAQVRPTASSPGMPPAGPQSSARMPAIARPVTPPPVPETPPRERIFGSVPPADQRAMPSFPPAPTFPPPSSRAAGSPPVGRAALPEIERHERSGRPERSDRPEREAAKSARANTSTKSSTTGGRKSKSSNRRRATMPPPGTVSALPPVKAASSVPGIQDPSRYEEITPMG